MLILLLLSTSRSSGKNQNKYSKFDTSKLMSCQGREAKTARVTFCAICPFSADCAFCCHWIFCCLLDFVAIGTFVAFRTFVAIGTLGYFGNFGMLWNTSVSFRDPFESIIYLTEKLVDRSPTTNQLLEPLRQTRS